MTLRRIFSVAVIICGTAAVGSAEDKPVPIAILNLPGSGTDPAKIDYSALPEISGTHAVISAAQREKDADPKRFDMHHVGFELHNYLLHHDGKFWCIWSDGPAIEDEPTQEIHYSTSRDGLNWSPPKSVTGTPEAPWAFIARGLWVRDGELLALAAYFRGKGAFGTNKDLELRAYAWDTDQQKWVFRKKLYDNAINNFPPQRLSTGEWILTRRDARFNVSVLIGGVKALDDWKSFPVVGIREVPGFRPDEPIFWPLPDGTLFALYRDNGGSQRLFHSTSTDHGRTWGTPVLTNFPNSSSKLFSTSTSRGYRVLVLNAHPKVGRRDLNLAISRDGRTFTHLTKLAIPSPPPAAEVGRIQQKFRSGIASLQYPHVIEHDDHLWIAFSRSKKQTEIFKVPLDNIDAVLK